MNLPILSTSAWLETNRLHRWTRTAVVAVFATAFPMMAGAQASPISLERAVDLARSNNPGFLATQNDLDVADWNVKSAYASLFPTASFGSTIGWQGSGDQNLGVLTAAELGFGDQPDFLTSSFNVSVGLQVSGSTLLSPGRARASRDRTVAQLRASVVTLEQQVATTYLEVLRQTEEVALAEQQLERARFNLRLAEAQRDVGQVTALDAQQAGVQVGRGEVTLLQAEQALRTARLRFLQGLGLPLNESFDLTSTFGLEAPRWTYEELFASALEQNPALQVQRDALRESQYDVKIAKSRYFPSLSLSTGIGGFAREATNSDFLVRQAEASIAGQVASCESQNDLFSRLADPLPLEDCSRFVFTDELRQSIVDDNNVFPFGFTRTSPSVSLSLSLPIFQGLSRQQQVETAQATRRDVDYQIREQQLALEADIAVATGVVDAAYQSALIEEQNQELADEQLRLAREQYTVGLISFVDLVEAETVKAEADRARIAAVYLYHDAITNLEATVGIRLRTVSGPGGP